jgi:protein-L-isoaspartate(D-aspartate) O-methyltransferase
MARLARRVVSVDIFPEFVEAARTKLAAENLRNVEFRTADALSLELAGRFDAIALTASVPMLDDYFVRMLRPLGRLFVVVGRAPVMEARLITLSATGDSTSESLFETVVTPMINAERPEPFVL